MENSQTLAGLGSQRAKPRINETNIYSGNTLMNMDTIFALDKQWRNQSFVEQRIASIVLSDCIERQEAQKLEQQRISFRSRVQEWNNRCAQQKEAVALREYVQPPVVSEDSNNAQRRRRKGGRSEIDSRASELALPEFPRVPETTCPVVTGLRCMVDPLLQMNTQTALPLQSDVLYVVGGGSTHWSAGTVQLTKPVDHVPQHKCKKKVKISQLTCDACWLRAGLVRPQFHVRTWEYVQQCFQNCAVCSRTDGNDISDEMKLRFPLLLGSISGDKSTGQCRLHNQPKIVTLRPNSTQSVDILKDDNCSILSNSNIIDRSNDINAMSERKASLSSLLNGQSDVIATINTAQSRRSSTVSARTAARRHSEMPVRFQDSLKRPETGSMNNSPSITATTHPLPPPPAPSSPLQLSKEHIVHHTMLVQDNHRNQKLSSTYRDILRDAHELLKNNEISDDEEVSVVKNEEKKKVEPKPVLNSSYHHRHHHHPTRSQNYHHHQSIPALPISSIHNNHNQHPIYSQVGDNKEKSELQFYPVTHTIPLFSQNESIQREDIVVSKTIGDVHGTQLSLDSGFQTKSKCIKPVDCVAHTSVPCDNTMWHPSNMSSRASTSIANHRKSNNNSSSSNTSSHVVKNQINSTHNNDTERQMYVDNLLKPRVVKPATSSENMGLITIPVQSSDSEEDETDWPLLVSTTELLASVGLPSLQNIIDTAPLAQFPLFCFTLTAESAILQYVNGTLLTHYQIASK